MSSLFKKITPLNVVEQRQLFFSNEVDNPVFEYSSESLPSTNELEQWGLPQEKYFELAKKILVAAQTEKNFSDKGQILSQDAVAQEVERTAQLIGSPLKLVFNPDQVARCKVQKNEISFRLPLTFDHKVLKQILNHEILTHALRRTNDEKNTWNTQPRLESEPDLRRTEEGLAIINTYIEHPSEYLALTSQLYIAVYLSSQLSFKEAFKTLCQMNISSQRAWTLCVRTKRGTQQTDHPGACTKDICYLEGTVELWKWLQDPDHNPQDLYHGKVSLSTLSQRKKMSNQVPVTPPFLHDIDQYKKAALQLGITNFFSTFV